MATIDPLEITQLWIDECVEVDEQTWQRYLLAAKKHPNRLSVWRLDRPVDPDVERSTEDLPEHR